MGQLETRKAGETPALRGQRKDVPPVLICMKEVVNRSGALYVSTVVLYEDY